MNLKLFKFGNTTWIHVGPVDYKSTDLQYPDYICANVPFDISVPDPQKCSTSLNATFSFSLQEPSFNLHAHFSNGSWSRIFSGYADDGTFSFIDGTFFNSSQPRLSTTFKNNTTTIYEEQTCTSFVSVPEAPKKAQKCKKFESQTLIINLSDNSTFASSIGRYEFDNGNNMTAYANFTGPSDLSVLFWINGYLCEGKKDCKTPIFVGDGKIIINSAIVKKVGSKDIGNSIPLIGRIVIRENETLMAEGIPFTHSNSCLKTNFKFGDSKVSMNQFCCTEFENV
uniref:Uncharacterized protein n=1 Tax=Panagrolaimus davidi TaxID=227884 RepID=A0A914PT54_9BILA